MNNLKLLLTALKNYKKKSLNREYIGYTIQKNVEVISKKEIQEFAKATRDNNSLYNVDNPILPPIYIAKIIWPEIKKIICQKNLKLNILKMVHAEQKIIYYKHVFQQDKLNLNISITNISSTPAGELIEFTSHVYTKSELAIEAVSSLIIRNSKRKSSSSNKKPEIKRKQLYQIDFHTEEGQQLEYARASLDNNFIHTNNFLAKLAGLKRTIMHGACIMAMCTHELIKKEANNNIQKLKEIKIRFAYPVFPDEILNIKTNKSETTKTINFNVFNKKKIKVLKDCNISFR